MIAYRASRHLITAIESSRNEERAIDIAILSFMSNQAAIELDKDLL